MDTQTFEKLKKIYDQADTFGKKLMEKEFPELSKTDDEKIKKSLISYLKFLSRCKVEAMTKATYEEWIDWLEKQGEQKHTAEVLPKGEDYGIDGLYHAVKILERTLGEVEGYQSDDGILEHKCAISAVEKLYTQTRWSKKDDAYSTLICSILNVEHPDGLYTTGGITFFQNAYIKNQQIKDWLNSIKQRLTIQTEESE